MLFKYDMPFACAKGLVALVKFLVTLVILLVTLVMFIVLVALVMFLVALTFSFPAKAPLNESAKRVAISTTIPTLVEFFITSLPKPSLLYPPCVVPPPTPVPLPVPPPGGGLGGNLVEDNWTSFGGRLVLFK